MSNAQTYELGATSDPRYKYVNVRFFNNTEGQSKDAVDTERRDGNVIDDPQNWEMAVDRFYIKSELPLYIPQLDKSSDSSLSVSYKEKSTGTVTTRVINCSKSQYYWFEDLITDLNSNLSALHTATGASGSAPTFSFSYTSAQVFSFSSDSATRTDFEIYFNYQLWSMFETFKYASRNSSKTSATFVQLFDTDTNTQYASTFENWDGVNSVLIESDLPLIFELTPPAITSTSNINTSVNSIITDFKLVNTDATSKKLINFTADGTHRWQSMTSSGSSFNKFTLRYYYTDYRGNKYPIVLEYEDSADAKLVFRRKSLLSDD